VTATVAFWPGQKNFDYTSIANEDPDAVYPEAAKDAHEDGTHEVQGSVPITGC
jgi:hypothetical protein